jgi:hypothetical protein
VSDRHTLRSRPYSRASAGVALQRACSRGLATDRLEGGSAATPVVHDPAGSVVQDSDTQSDANTDYSCVYPQSDTEPDSESDTGCSWVDPDCDSDASYSCVDAYPDSDSGYSRVDAYPDSDCSYSRVDSYPDSGYSRVDTYPDSDSGYSRVDTYPDSDSGYSRVDAHANSRMERTSEDLKRDRWLVPRCDGGSLRQRARCVEWWVCGYTTVGDGVDP